MAEPEPIDNEGYHGFEEAPEVEYDSFVLEDQLLDHLATPEGAMAIYREGITSNLLPKDEENARLVLDFVRSYIEEHRKAPDVSVIDAEIGLGGFREPTTEVGYVIDKVRKRYQFRQVSKSLDSAADRINRNHPDEALNYALDELRRIKLESTSKKGVITTRDLNVVERYRARQQAGAKGITFGYQQIDDHLGGLKVGELSIVLARPKRYKSWQLLKSATDAHLEQYKNVAFATLELSEEEMTDRFLCMVAGVSWAKFKHDQLRQEEQDELDRCERQLFEYEPSFHFFRPKAGERKPENLLDYAGEMGADVLYIDQLSWLDGAREEGKWGLIGDYLEQLKIGAQNFPIYMAAQYNRLAAAEDGLADISKAGLSDFIGQTADNLFAIYASNDMLNSTPKIIHFGLQESRSFEKCAWEIKVDLSANSNFKCLGELT